MPFCDRTLSFLMENRLMDSREWFHQHRDEFDLNVLEPMAELLNELAPMFLEIDPQFMIIPKMGKSISRVWRDTRFLKDKTIFRDNLWFSVLREKYVGLPEFFFSVSPRGCEWGCGWYQTGGDTVKVIRERILKGDRQFNEALAALEDQNSFTLEGDKLKKTRHPDMPENIQNWLDRKTFYVLAEDRGDLMFSPELKDVLARDFKAMAPIYRFFRDSTVLRERRG